MTLLTLVLPASEVHMLGVRIDDPKEVLDNLKLEVIAKEGNSIKYKTENGNVLSITHENGKVVYMENDWLHEESGEKPIYSDFIFGKTTLSRIFAKYGSEGFYYKNNSFVGTDSTAVFIICFKFDSPKNEILATVGSLEANFPDPDVKAVDVMTLEAIIIAKKEYLDAIWGEEKAYYEDRVKIKP